MLNIIESNDLYVCICFSYLKDSFDKYLDSEFNDSNEPEYECMEWYLLANADVISITIADHCNI